MSICRENTSLGTLKEPETRYAETRTLAISWAHMQPLQNGGRSVGDGWAIGLASSSDCWIESGDLKTCAR